jgi:hypothetical protein
VVSANIRLQSITSSKLDDVSIAGEIDDIPKTLANLSVASIAELVFK